MKAKQEVLKLKQQYQSRINQISELIDIELKDHNVKVITSYHMLKTRYENYIDMIDVILGNKEIKDLL